MRILVNKKFPMLLLHLELYCQQDAGDKFFRKMKQNKAVSREIRSFHLEYRPYLNEKIPHKYSFIRKISVVLSM